MQSLANWSLTQKVYVRTFLEETFREFMLYIFRAIETYKQVYHQQTALIPGYQSTPTCFVYYL